MVTTQEQKVYENRLRRMAERQGLALSKSRRRDPRALDFDRWAILDERGRPVAGVDSAGRHTFELTNVEAWLIGEGRLR